MNESEYLEQRNRREEEQHKLQMQILNDKITQEWEYHHQLMLGLKKVDGMGNRRKRPSPR